MKTIVIGAGVAGLFFANFMGKSNVKVLDKNEFAGRKLLVTGNGRCNFTNLNYGVDNFTSSNDDFVKNIIDYFTNRDLIDYFHEIGIATTHLPSGRCYPKTMSSKTVRDSLYLSAKENTEFIFNEEVTDIDFIKKSIVTSKNLYKYDKLVIATGGTSLRNSGSDGKLFNIIRDDIPLSKMTYAITNYETKQRLSKKAKGTKVSARAILFVDGKYVRESIDDIIFQDYGLTGTAILDLSNDLSLYLMKNRKCEIRIDFFPEYNRKDFRDFLYKLSKKFPNRTIKEILIGIINEKLIDDILKISSVSFSEISGNLSDKDFDNLAKSLKSLSFSVKKIHDKENAQVTIGGVDIRYINPKSMASTIYPDVFFIGECLEVAGACGGYNISWAASTAKVASDYIRSLDV